MRFIALESAHFANLEISEPLKFGEGLNILAAPNQAGKSTLLLLLTWMLYGVPPKSTKRDQAAKDQQAPWLGGQPRASLTIAPELEGWPEAVRLVVAFEDFRPIVTDVATQEDLTERITVHRNGAWDLGELLTGLSGQAFSSSLLAEQGELTAILDEEELRRLLTLDLAEIVEDPDRSSIDAALNELSKPTFVLPGAAENPVQIPYLRKATADEYQMSQAALTTASEKYQELMALLARQQAAETLCAQEQGRLSRLEKDLKYINLAMARWRYSVVGRLQAQLDGWEPRLKDEPWLAKFPYSLEGDLERWQGEFSAQENERGQVEYRLRSEEGKLSRLDAKLSERQALTDQVGDLPALGELSLQLGATFTDLAEANRDVAKHGEGERPETRHRYEELDDELEPHLGYAGKVFEWGIQNTTLADEMRKVAGDQARLDAVANRNISMFFGATIVLAVLGIVAIVLGLLSVLITPAWLAYVIGAVCIVGAIAVFIPGSKWRVEAVAAKIELEKVIGPRLRELKEHKAQIVETAGRICREHDVDEPMWTRLVEIVPEHQGLQYQLKKYDEARRSRAAAEKRITGYWVQVSGLLPDCPERPLDDWLTERIEQLESVKALQKQRTDSLAQVKDFERDLKRRQELLSEHADKLKRLLTPLHLDSMVDSDQTGAVHAFRVYMAAAKQYEGCLADFNEASAQARDLSYTSDEYTREWGLLSASVQEQLTDSVHDEGGYDALVTEERKLRDAVSMARTALDDAWKEASRHREDVARNEGVLTKYPQLKETAAQAAMRFQAVRTWGRALELLQDSLRAIQYELGSNLAPRLSDALKSILMQAPVEGVEDAALGPQLELRLIIKDAPVGLMGSELLERLSSGARHHLALAMRLAVAKVLGEEKAAMCVMLDEPLAELDDERAAACLRYLVGLSVKHQVVLTTCHREHTEQLLLKVGSKASWLSIRG